MVLSEVEGLTVLSKVEGLTTLSNVEGQITMTEIQNLKLLVIGYWNLEFICYLDIGIWALNVTVVGKNTV